MWIGAGVSAAAGVWSLKLFKMTRADTRKMRGAIHVGHSRRSLVVPEGTAPTLMGSQSQDLATADDYAGESTS